MTPNPALLKSIEKLDYRVTVGDVAAQAGLDLNLAQQGLLALASEAGGHLQVAESGDMVFLFPRNFRSILRNKYWQLRLKEILSKIWAVLFYLIRISFGIILGLSIVVMMLAIAILVIAISSQRNDNDSGGGDSGGGNWGGSNQGGFSFFPTDFFWIFYPNYGYGYDSPHQRPSQSAKRHADPSGKLNFLEAIFSFLFGEGDPNFDREERRWQQIGTVIQNQGGVIAAPQLTPYLDNVTRLNEEDEDYILPVLSRFNGYPKVSPEGDIVYAFPELQVTAQQRQSQPVAAYLKEKLFRFSEATSGQVLAATGLGGLNIILALVLGSLLRDPSLVAQLGSFIGFVSSIYGLLLGYAIAFLGIPLIRYFVIQGRNRRIEARNSQRQAKAQVLNQSDAILQRKLAFARQFSDEKVITAADLAYTTEQDVLAQEAERSDKTDEEWRKRLELL